MSEDVDVYAVGMLSALLYAWRARQHGSSWRVSLALVRYEVKFLARRIRRRDWRAAHNVFNGYLAEPQWQQGWTRCGHGWTKRRALADLEHHLRTGR